jgi:hypothetical protein
MEFSIMYFVWMFVFCMAMYWLWVKWAKLDMRQSIFLAGLIILCILNAELRERKVLRECGERVAEILETEQDVQTR